jgi:N-methylhydantoinase B
MNTPIESLEAYLPLRFNSYSLRIDTGGAGKHRGGCGIERSWTLTAPKATLSILAERTKIPPWGLQEGKPGALGEFWLIKPDGEKIKLKAKCTITIHEGDKIIILTPGGGGYGAPLLRRIDEVMRDVQNGFVSPESAERDYGVAIDPLTHTVDDEKTIKLRSKL